MKKNYMKSAISVIALVGALFSGQSAQSFFGKSVILPRSQGVNAARELVGWQQFINLDSCENYWAVAFNPTYNRTRACSLDATVLDGNCVTFSGSAVPNRSPNDFLADYLGLPLDYKSSMHFEPYISQFIVDFDFYYGLDCFSKGLYFRIHAPIVHANWDLNPVETVCNASELGFPAGYMAAHALVREDLPATAEEALHGKTTFGDMQDPLAYGLVFGREHKVHLADLQFIVGKNFIANECAHAGLNLRLYAPVGNRICSEFLFDPVMGNGKHWEFGIGFTGHTYIYGQNWCNEESPMAVYLDANFTHLFSAKSLRSFDFKSTTQRNGKGSRYMLIEQIAPPSNELFIGVDGPAAPNQYVRQLHPAINKSTLCTETKIALQADIALKFSWMYNCVEYDLGYNFWYRSKEKLVCRQRFPENQFAFKGDSQLYGFTATNMPIPLSATQNNASVRGGQGAGNFVADQQLQNLNIDNPVQAQGPNAATSLFNISLPDTYGYLRTTVQTSNPAIFISDADIDVCSALVPRALSHKIFGNIGYTWHDDECLEPYLGVGAEVEWAPQNIKCGNSGLSQWGVWIKGGFAG